MQIATAQEPVIISDNEQDSVFCAKKYPFYDFENNDQLSGITIPEKAIEGCDYSIIEINKIVADSILLFFNSQNDTIFLVMNVLVDSDGYVRGAILLNKNESNFLMANQAYRVLKSFKYSPALHRGKPIVFFFPLVINYPKRTF